MAGFTNRGKFLLMKGYFQNAGLPTSQFFVALCDSSIAPGPTTNVLSDLAEVPAGNGYTAGGIAVARSAVGFPTITEDDSGNLGKIDLLDLVWTASGGNLPASGAGARYAVLLDDNATVGSRQVIAYWDLTSNRIVSVGQTLTLHLAELQLTET